MKKTILYFSAFALLLFFASYRNKVDLAYLAGSEKDIQISENATTSDAFASSRQTAVSFP